MATIGTVLADARRRLRAAPFAPSSREAALLMGHVLGWNEAQVLARRERPLSDAERDAFEALLVRRLAGEPVAYLLGEREFYGRPFYVDRRVLIPRPETEHLVEAALALPLPPAPRIADLGTGCGAIALTLAIELPRARLWAVDRSLPALAVARANRRRHDRGDLRRRVALLAGDLATAVDLEALDLIVSNPPYVARREARTLSPEVVAYEPHEALFAPGDDGRSVLRRLLGVAARLRPGATTVLEIGYDQAAWLERQVECRPGLVVERLIADYGGIPRIAVLRTVAGDDRPAAIE
ncbi:MAG: peptide chain release factor N(5)-glutamine methyltransferase [Acidobacteria bacterium]|nr:MAG: peptide chain release factor N(5)-glutamine methyltransferase [Acidobacteriota bacterium]